MTTDTRAMRILIVDDHTLVRTSVRRLLESKGGWVVVGEAADGRDATKRLGEIETDVVLMDIGMPVLDGIQATAQIRQSWPHLRVVLLTMRSGSGFVERALAAGAHAFCAKDCSESELFAALAHSSAGRPYLSRTAGQAAMAHRAGAAGSLTPRQQQIISLIAMDHTSKEIARALGISVKTVDSHRTNLMRQLGVHCLSALVRYAIGNGYVSLDDCARVPEARASSSAG